MKVLYKNAVLLVLFLISSIVLCGCISEKEATVGGIGTVTYVELEGGFYGIVADNGNHYNPINLPSNLKVDGLRVKFKGIVREDLQNIQMWGTLIELTHIEEIS